MDAYVMFTPWLYNRTDLNTSTTRGTLPSHNASLLPLPFSHNTSGYPWPSHNASLLPLPSHNASVPRDAHLFDVGYRLRFFLEQPPYLLAVLLALAAILFNLLSIAALTHARNRLNSHFRLIVSLAVSDSLVGVSILAHITNKVFNPSIVPGTGTPGQRLRSRCLFMGIKALNSTALNISLLNLMGMSVDHYLAITRPLKYQELLGPSRMRAMTLCLWLLALAAGFSDFLSPLLAPSLPPPPRPPFHPTHSGNRSSMPHSQHSTTTHYSNPSPPTSFPYIYPSPPTSIPNNYPFTPKTSASVPHRSNFYNNNSPTPFSYHSQSHNTDPYSPHSPPTTSGASYNNPFSTHTAPFAQPLTDASHNYPSPPLSDNLSPSPFSDTIPAPTHASAPFPSPTAASTPSPTASLAAGYNYCERVWLSRYQEEFSVLLTALLCLFVMLAIYIRLYVIVRRHKAPGDWHPPPGGSKRDARKNRRALVTTLLILGSFISCWLPTCLFQLVMMVLIAQGSAAGISDSLLQLLRTVDKYLMNVLLLNCLCDPIIYTIRCKEVRVGYKRLFARCCCRAKPHMTQRCKGARSFMLTRSSSVDKHPYAGRWTSSGRGVRTELLAKDGAQSGEVGQVGKAVFVTC